MLQVLVSVKEELARVKLDHDTRHGPDVTFLVPSLVLEDNFGRAVLSSIDDSCVPLVLISCTSEVNYFDLATAHFVPLTTQLLLALAREIARIIVVTALLTTINAPLILYLLEKRFKMREL